MTDLPLFDITVPLTRHNPDGSRDYHDVTATIPSTDAESAASVAAEIGWAIVTHLPKTDGNNEHGWKIQKGGARAEVSR